MSLEVPTIDLSGDIVASVHEHGGIAPAQIIEIGTPWACLLYTSDAADERSSVDLGGRRIIKKKKTHKKKKNKTT